MSAKAFYQTFFQTEQLFRRADDALAFPGVFTPQVATDAVVAELIAPDPIIVTISDPILPPAAIEKPQPTAVEQPESEPIAVLEPVQTPEQVAAVADDSPASAPKAPPADEAPATTPPQRRRPATPLLSQKVLILVDEDLLPSDLLFLEKILKAVHLDIDGVDLLNVHGTTNVDFNELLAGKYIHHFFTFGVPFNRINLDILMDRYQPVRFSGITFLMADPLPAIETDVLLKKKLWEALKKVFLWR